MQKPRAKKKLGAVLVFGEDRNDVEAIKGLIRKIVPTEIVIRSLRQPIILDPIGAAAQKRKSNADRLSDAVKIEAERYDVRCVIVHRDTDAVEPAHVRVGVALKRNFSPRLVAPVVAAVPAWELEAWLMLFPGAFSAFRSCWSPLSISGGVGQITDAKETLRRRLRSASLNCGDYSEMHAGPIAALAAPDLAAVHAMTARSASFAEFIDDLKKHV